MGIDFRGEEEAAAAARFSGEIECQKPNDQIYKFDGVLKM
jgi:hypothetical protein